MFPVHSFESLLADPRVVRFEVLPDHGIGLAQSDTALEATSVTLRGRPGQTVSGVFRVANLGNNGPRSVEGLTMTHCVPNERVVVEREPQRSPAMMSS